MTDRRLLDELTGALFWIAAFSFACGVFFCLTLALRDLPPTPPVAIGVVTIQHVSKLRDYLTAALFFVVVPPLTVWLRRLGERLDGHRRRLVIPQHRTLASILFAVPYFLSPALYLTTGKIGWVLLLPIVLSMAIPRLIAYVDGRLWVRQMVRREIVPFHALILAAAMSWILFRYLVVWKRIAHIPTLFLEIVFVLLFLTIFFVIAMYTAFAAKLLFGADHEAVLRRIAIASSLIAFLPLIALFWVPTWNPVAVIAIAFLLLALIAVRIRRAPSSRATWKFAAYAIVPALIYCVSYASSAHGSQWIDLFHRGESVGPASDYLRGKVPYRDVFVLHGMLEDGQLDAWLMQIFGRTIDISVTQSVVLGSFLALSL